MAINSHAFGRVKLTGRDAKKFKAQVTHGKPKKAAVEAVKRGMAINRQSRENGGKILITVKRG